MMEAVATTVKIQDQTHGRWWTKQYHQYSVFQLQQKTTIINSSFSELTYNSSDQIVLLLMDNRLKFI